MSTPERLTLAERMARAAERTAAERMARGGVAALRPPEAPARPAAPAAAPASAASGHGGHWQIPGRHGEHLTLMPGQMHFGGQVASLRTLLGSCLSVTLWHPERKLGGMCHFLLPSRQRKAGDALDGRYGDEALEAMVALLRATRTSPGDYHAHLYGGADTMPEGTSLKFNVGERNIEQGFSLVDRYGFQIQGVDVGEDVPRTVTLKLASGEVDMRRGVGAAPQHHLQGSLRRS
jgi:chemotaxis protein CheD